MRPATMKNIIHEFLISRIKNSRITFHILAEKSLSFHGAKNVSVYKFRSGRRMLAEKSSWKGPWAILTGVDCIKTSERQRVVHVQVAFM